MHQVTIRSARAADAEVLSALLVQLGYNATPGEVQQRLKFIVDSSSALFVAEHEVDGVVGCVQALVDVRFAEGRFGELVSLVVNSNNRGQGIGTRLIAAVESWLKENAVSTLRIRCNEKRTDAKLFYAKIGMKQIKTQAILEKQL